MNNVEEISYKLQTKRMKKKKKNKTGENWLEIQKVCPGDPTSNRRSRKRMESEVR